MKFYKKELVSRPLRLPNGATVSFTEVADDTGILGTDDGYLINELNNAINRKVGGVVAISAEEFGELKKNPPGKPSPPPWLSAQQLNQMVRQSRVNVVAEGSRVLPPPPKPVNPPPLSVPDSVPVVAKAGPRRGGVVPGKSSVPVPASE